MTTETKKPFTEKDCFVALFDILGFSDLVNNSELNKVAMTYSKTRETLEHATREIRVIIERNLTVRCFSDSFLIYTHSVNNNSFRALITAIDYLFLAAVENNLPIRGAVTVGNLLFNKAMELGTPIVKAHEREMQQEWIGCWITDACTKRITNLSRYLNDGNIVEYEIPLKKGQVKPRYAFNWVHSILSYIYIERNVNKIEGQVTKKDIIQKITFFNNDTSDWSVKRKYDNTKKFIEFVMKHKAFKQTLKERN